MYLAEPFVLWKLFKPATYMGLYMYGTERKKSNSYVFLMHSTKFTNCFLLYKGIKHRPPELRFDRNFKIHGSKKTKLIFLYLPPLYSFANTGDLNTGDLTANSP
jgi:hypothetical protein